MLAKQRGRIFLMMGLGLVALLFAIVPGASGALARLPASATAGPPAPGKAQVATSENKISASGLAGPKTAKAYSAPDAVVEYKNDDGVRENAIGFGTTTTETAAIWLNRFTPGNTNYPVTLNPIQVYYPTQPGISR